jgi:hypothetical protein
MADWLVYWKLFPEKNEPWPVGGWRIMKGSRLTEVQKGDRLWLIVSGESCNAIKWSDEEQEAISSLGHPSGESCKDIRWNVVAGAGYLAEIFTVARIGPEEFGPYSYLIEGKKGLCIAIDPPLDVDTHLKALSKKPNKHVGMRCQTPRVMASLTVDAMKKQLKKRYPEHYAILFGLS